MLKAMLVAATRAEELLDTVKEKMRQILGSVGAHKEHATLTSMAASAWNWAALPRRVPAANEEHAFRIASSPLLPYLKKSMYPVGTAFAGVPRAWPSATELVAQYRMLCKRVRCAMQAATSTGGCRGQVPPEVVRAARSWSSASSLSVCHLGYFGEVLLLFIPSCACWCRRPAPTQLHCGG